MRKYPIRNMPSCCEALGGGRQNVFHPPMDGATEKQQRCGQVKMAAHLCVFIRFDHYPANHRTNQQGNIPVVVQQGNETCQEYIKSRLENRFEI